MLEVTVDEIGRAYWQPYFKGRYAPVIQRPDFGDVIYKRRSLMTRVGHRQY